MPQLPIINSSFMYSPCGLFTKNKERINKFKETEDSRYIYQNELDKTCFQHDMTNADFKDPMSSNSFVLIKVCYISPTLHFR